MDEIAVLVLNATYEPLHFTNARRAVTLLLAGKAEPVEASPRVVRSPSRVFALPAVIRLAVFIRKPFLDRVAFNKKNILRRDGYTCQYCSRRGERLTVDHIVPRSRGGDTSWTNVVAACLRCNLKKGQSAARRGGHATVARAGASQVRVLHPYAETSSRALAPRTPGGSTSSRFRRPRSRPQVFKLTSEYSPRGDQPQAIKDLAVHVRAAAATRCCAA
jgi:5-methylcytosine-specific restriction endonuclease McrA